MYIDTKERGFVYEPINPVNLLLYQFLEKHQSTLDGSRMYDDLIDVYLNLEEVYKEEVNNELITTNRTNGSGRDPVTGN